MRLVLSSAFILLALVLQARADVLGEALTRAMAQFAAAAPHLGRNELGVNRDAYAAALTSGQFTKEGASVSLYYEEDSDPAGHCGRFAAYTMLPPRDGVIRLVFCPRFFTPGADELRTLTILHELVHAVTDANECRAMAYAARIEKASTGRFTPVDAYWQNNGCAGSGFSLP